MKLSEFIRDHSDALLADWEAFGRSLPQAADDRDRQALRDSAAETLADLADDMEQPANVAHRGEPVGLSSLAAQVNATAARHAGDRSAQKSALNQLLAGYRALRTSIIRRWVAELGTVGPAQLDELARFNEAVDASLVHAISWYEARLGHAEDALSNLTRRSEQRFQALVSATSDVLYRMNPDWSEMQELDGGGFISDTRRPTRSWFDEYIHPDDKSMVMQAIEDAVRNRSVFELEHRVQRLDGTWGWTLSRAIPLLDENGAIIEWFGAASDVTARKQAEERLRAADRAKDEFLAVLGHELRNPLAPLRTGLDLLEHARSRPDLIAQVQPMMERQLAHLVRLVDDLLDLSRISRGRIKLQRAPLDLNVPVKVAIEQVATLMTDRRHELQVFLSGTPLQVNGDLERLTQVIANLLSNAAKHTDAGGRISVTSEASGAQAIVRVRDTGFGIPADRFEMLFELFTQIPEHRKLTGGGGLGIGLAVSSQLVKLHGGSIDATSEGEGRGSEFVVRLPLLGSDPAT